MTVSEAIQHVQNQQKQHEQISPNQNKFQFNITQVFSPSNFSINNMTNENSTRIRGRNRRDYRHHQNDKNDCLSNPLSSAFIIFVIVYFYIYFYENQEINENNDSYNETNRSLM